MVYGRVGTEGRTIVKKWSNKSKAQLEANKIRKYKKEKGYLLVNTR